MIHNVELFHIYSASISFIIDTGFIFDSKFVKKHESVVMRINAGLQRSFLVAICVGRLFPVARSLTPAMAGAAGLSRIRFHLFDVIACTTWACGLGLLIIGLGDFLLSYI